MDEKKEVPRSRVTSARPGALAQGVARMHASALCRPCLGSAPAPHPTPTPLLLRLPGAKAGAYLEVIPVLGPALGSHVPRVAQQRLPDGLLRVLLQELPDLLSLGQELLLKLQTHLLSLLLQPAGLLQNAGLLERTGQEGKKSPAFLHRHPGQGQDQGQDMGLALPGTPGR